MSQLGKSIRLRRLLREDRCTLVVAFDHALVLGPIAGTRDPHLQIQRFATGGADAILLNLGLFPRCLQAEHNVRLPALIARLDWTTAFSEAGKSDSGAFQSCMLSKATQTGSMPPERTLTDVRSFPALQDLEKARRVKKSS